MSSSAKGVELQLRQRIIGTYLRASREQAGLTQAELAKVLGYSTAQFVSNWERGISLPPLDVLPVVAKALAIRSQTFIDVICRYQDELLKVRRQEIRRIFRDRR